MKRYVWFAAVYCCILMDMKTGKPVGSVLPQENGDCIIRYGHNPDQAMQEDVVDFLDTPKTTMFKAAGVICGRLMITDDDPTALTCFNPDLNLKGCAQDAD